MLYKRILTALCLAAFLSAATMKSSVVDSSSSGYSLQSILNSILSYTDSATGKIGFKNTASFVKFSIFLMIALPLFKYLTDGKKANAASSDEELGQAVKAVREKLSYQSLKSLSKELMYKLIRMIRSKLGYRSYLLTIKEEKMKNSDGSKTDILELKTVPGTGWCKALEDAAENLVFFGNIAVALSVFQTMNHGLAEGNLLEVAKATKFDWKKFF